jgi:hypothetical protein
MEILPATTLRDSKTSLLSIIPHTKHTTRSQTYYPADAYHLLPLTVFDYSNNTPTQQDGTTSYVHSTKQQDGTHSQILSSNTITTIRATTQTTRSQIHSSSIIRSTTTTTPTTPTGPTTPTN